MLREDPAFQLAVSILLVILAGSHLVTLPV